MRLLTELALLFVPLFKGKYVMPLACNCPSVVGTGIVYIVKGQRSMSNYNVITWTSPKRSDPKYMTVYMCVLDHFTIPLLFFKMMSTMNNSTNFNLTYNDVIFIQYIIYL